MPRIKSVGIKELKSKLSAYLREVRAGEHILVTDRDEVIAEIRRPSEALPTRAALVHPTLQEWSSHGLLRFPTVKRGPVPESAVSTDRPFAQELLDAERGE